MQLASVYKEDCINSLLPYIKFLIYQEKTGEWPLSHWTKLSDCCNQARYLVPISIFTSPSITDEKNVSDLFSVLKMGFQKNQKMRYDFCLILNSVSDEKPGKVMFWQWRLLIIWERCIVSKWFIKLELTLILFLYNSLSSSFWVQITAPVSNKWKAVLTSKSDSCVL